MVWVSVTDHDGHEIAMHRDLLLMSSPRRKKHFYLEFHQIGSAQYFNPIMLYKPVRKL